jgi:hypothetical protein
MTNRLKDKSRTFTFSANPDFIEEVKQHLQEPFSNAVVKGLRLYLEREDSGWGTSVTLQRRLGTLVETLEFTGRWIVPPDQPIEAAVDDSILDGTSSVAPIADAKGNAHRIWWSAALTRKRSFIWFYSARKDGLTAGEFEYSVQKKSDLHSRGFWIVPASIYEQVRKTASPLPPVEIG